MVRKENLIAQETLQPLDFYFNLNGDEVVYVKNLKVQAPKLIKEAEERSDIKIYKANVAHKSSKVKWIQHVTFGIETPTTLQIKFSNGVKVIEYFQFDTDDTRTEEEMMELLPILDGFGNKMTGCKIIEDMLPDMLRQIPKGSYMSPELREYYYMLSQAFRGGANAVLQHDVIRSEIHIDYHQLYSSVMINNRFPYLEPEIVDGYYKSDYAIYRIKSGMARLKPNGYALIPCWDDIQSNSMFGIDGDWHDLRILVAVSSPDLQLLYDNYEIKDFEIDKTIYYPLTFSGAKHFSGIVHDIYEKRKTTTGAQKTFWKLCNEYLAGFFERTIRPGRGWWSDTHYPKAEEFDINPPVYNPIVGIFITAYGRQRLNALLHMFSKGRVIGYDTDCVFFNGDIQEVPKKVLELFGDGIGELHYDGIYKNVKHVASKCYYGRDAVTNEPFMKAAGVPKSGYAWVWNKKTREYEKQEARREWVKKNYMN